MAISAFSCSATSRSALGKGWLYEPKNAEQAGWRISPL
jgi:hypothetical protein